DLPHELGNAFKVHGSGLGTRRLQASILIPRATDSSAAVNETDPRPGRRPRPRRRGLAGDASQTPPQSAAPCTVEWQSSGGGWESPSAARKAAPIPSRRWSKNAVRPANEASAAR